MNDIAARRSMTDATGRLNLSCCGRECGKRPNQRLCSVSARPPINHAQPPEKFFSAYEK